MKSVESCRLRQGSAKEQQRDLWVAVDGAILSTGCLGNFFQVLKSLLEGLRLLRWVLWLC